VHYLLIHGIITLLLPAKPVMIFVILVQVEPGMNVQIVMQHKIEK
jgi:hypothetical protein